MLVPLLPAAADAIALTFTPVADATLTAEKPTTNFGTSPTLETDHDPVKHFLLRFEVSDLQGRQVTSVRLRLVNYNAARKGGDVRVASSAWPESGPDGVTLASATAPASPLFDPAGPVLASFGTVSSSAPAVAALPTGLVPGDGTVSFVVSSTSSDGAGYWSREKGDGFAPLLEVTVEGAAAPPTISVSVGDARVDEGDDGITWAMFAVRLSRASDETVTVSFATQAATATEGNDYTRTTGTATFAPGDLEEVASVGVLGDTVEEPDETFLLKLSGSSGPVIADGEAVGTITDDDAAQPAVLTFRPVADATLLGDMPSTNLGSSPTLETDNSPVKHFLLRFEVTGVGERTVSGVKLRLVNSNSSAKGGNFRAAGNGWTENGVTFANATSGPTPIVDPSAPVLASLGSVSSGAVEAVLLPSAVAGDGTWSFAVSSTSSDGADYWSREKGGSLVPVLEVTAGTGTPPPPPPVGSGPIQFVDHSSTFNKGSNTFSVPAPRTYQEGDVLVAVITGGYAHVVAAPPGWQIIQENVKPSPVDDLAMQSYWKVAGASEPAAWSWTLGSTVNPETQALAAATVTVWRGVDTAAPVWSWGVRAETPDRTKIECPSVDGLAGGVLVCGYALDDPDVLSEPPGMTFVTNFSFKSDDTHAVAYGPLSSTGPTGIRPAGTNNVSGGSNDFGVAVVLKPAP
jgi:hypothetical protein